MLIPLKSEFWISCHFVQFLKTTCSYLSISFAILVAWSFRNIAIIKSKMCIKIYEVKCNMNLFHSTCTRLPLKKSDQDSLLLLLILCFSVKVCGAQSHNSQLISLVSGPYFQLWACTTCLAVLYNKVLFCCVFQRYFLSRAQTSYAAHGTTVPASLQWLFQPKGHRFFVSNRWSCKGGDSMWASVNNKSKRHWSEISVYHKWSHKHPHSYKCLVPHGTGINFVIDASLFSLLSSLSPYKNRTKLCSHAF